MICDPVRSYADFIYPFRFDPRTFDQRAAAVKRASRLDGTHRTRYWSIERSSPAELLPHVADYFNPLDGKQPTAHLWCLEQLELQLLRRLGSTGWVAANAPQARAAARPRHDEWILDTPHGDISVKLERIRLALFKSGVGSVIVSARPTTGEVASWLDFVHYFRFADGRRRVKFRGGAGLRQWPPWQDCVHREASNDNNVNEWLPAGMLAALVQTAKTGTEKEPWWEEIFVRGQLLPFVSLFIEDVPPGETAPLAYRVRNFFNSSQEGYPGASELANDQATLLPYAKDQWLFFSIDGGGFFASNAPATPFYQSTLPGHMRAQYFLAFLLVLHQRFVLIGLLREVADDWLGATEEARVAAFEDIRHRFLDFSSRDMWAQAMQREHHHRAYRRWQEVLEIERLYREVGERIRDMHGAALQYKLDTEARAARSLERTVGVVGALIGFPALVAAFLDIHLKGVLKTDDGLSFVVALLLVVAAAPIGALLLVGILRAIEKRRD